MCNRAGSTPLESSSLEGRFTHLHDALGLTFANSTAVAYAKLPFSVLRPDAWPLRALSRLPGTGDLSEVLHLS